MGFVEVTFRAKTKTIDKYSTHITVAVPEQDIKDGTSGETEALEYLVKTYGLDKLELEYLYEDDYRD